MKKKNKKSRAAAIGVLLFAFAVLLCSACAFMGSNDSPEGEADVTEDVTVDVTNEPEESREPSVSQELSQKESEEVKESMTDAPETQETLPPETQAAVIDPPKTQPIETAPAETQAPVIENYDDGQWNMILVNPHNYLPENFEPQLQDIGGGQYADYRVVDALESMMADCRAAGYSPYICSSYRSYERQVTLYENKVNQYMGYGYTRDMAEAYASMWVAVPGTSEHHTGLAFDIVASDYIVLDNSQATRPTQQWLMANCHKYGFILRYPEDKVIITDINYEPWHYRYVGVEAATYIMEKGICFEEYLEGK